MANNTPQSNGEKPRDKAAAAAAANTQSSSSVESQVAFLQEFISSPTTEEDATANLATLLQQLDAADGVAKGVESKLDKLLENLEGMLHGLEGKDGQTAVDGTKADEKDDPEPAKPPNQSTAVKDSG